VTNWAWYWLIWALVLLVTFAVPETIALLGHDHGTLSDQVWRLIGTHNDMSMRTWSGVHFLFAGIFGVLEVWLWWHFVEGLFT
jgi:hypothetical protein